LVTEDGCCAWRTEYNRPEYGKHAFGDAWICALFRNTAPERYLSSDLIVAAPAVTRRAWGEPPPQGTLTSVDARQVRPKAHPGYCFRRAGFVPAGRTRTRDLLALRLAPDAHPAAAAPGGLVSRAPSWPLVQQAPVMGPSGFAEWSRCLSRAAAGVWSPAKCSTVTSTPVRCLDEWLIESIPRGGLRSPIPEEE
jgi:hypothetical protein